MSALDRVARGSPAGHSTAGRAPHGRTAALRVSAPVPARHAREIAVPAAWLIAAMVSFIWRDLIVNARTGLFSALEAVIGLTLAVLYGLRIFPGPLRTAGNWLVALPVILTLWEIATAKTGILPLPFFPPPQAIVEVYTDDFPRLAVSAGYSLALLLPGYLIGALAGFLIGVGIGWSRIVSYWGNPLLRFVGPLPATAWMPVAFYFFPTSRSASTFLIALATAFPVAVLTASGVRGVSKSLYDVARTFNAGTSFMLWRVAIPAALPNVFVGLFMGLGASFAVLIVAEMMGVKAGLGWYLQWAQGWAAYANLYGALLVMAFLFSGLIALLFAIRDRCLRWQKGMLQW